MTFVILALGFLFGAALQWGRLNRFDTISGLATLEDLTIGKALLLAIGVGFVALNVEIALGGASYHVKPFVLGGILVGGLVFGAGMAMLGYCPGTLAVSIGEGSLDALVGLVGGLLGGLVYTLTLPVLAHVLGPNLGKVSLFSLTGGFSPLFFALTGLLGAGLIGAAFLLARREPAADRRWLYSGLALALLDVVTFSSAVTNRPVGASTSYPYVADQLARAVHNGYFAKIAKPGHWELIFLSGALLAGFVLSLATKRFEWKLVHARWNRHKGSSAGKRILFAAIGGFLLIYGARMAGGCTSGHVLSGGMQGAISSWVFGICALAGLVVTGKLFYRPGRVA